MKKTIYFVMFAGFLIGSTFNSLPQVMNSSLPGQQFKGSIFINAPADKIWNLLTDVKKHSAIMGSEYLGGAKTFSKVGENARLKEMGDEGTLFLSFIKHNSEIRYSWEVDGGSYLCQERWLLTTENKGTKVTFIERYTESGKQSSEELSKQTAYFNEAINRLKKMSESK
ncbi:MAG TPA: SRPBCC domain-containing protein [Ignavibacteriaceae bacterium]|nr:SRPBCC domain-containing protein [Ignavibacteriaceae bacterium]